MMDSELIRVSKYLSFLLRHRPGAIGLQLDANGWALIDELIAKTTRYPLSRDVIRVIVETNDKQRFSISPDGGKIRANQGHTIAVDLELQPQPPPAVLYHGTGEKFISNIRHQGLRKMKRHHVHLTAHTAVAKAVGERHGKPKILLVLAAEMKAAGHVFFRSENDVWLVDHVPVAFIKFENNAQESI